MNRENVNAVDDETGRTPLAFAAKYDLDDIVMILLENGAVVNIFDTDLNTPLHYAALGGKSEIWLQNMAGYRCYLLDWF